MKSLKLGDCGCTAAPPEETERDFDPNFHLKDPDWAPQNFSNISGGNSSTPLPDGITPKVQACPTTEAVADGLASLASEYLSRYRTATIYTINDAKEIAGIIRTLPRRTDRIRFAGEFAAFLQAKLPIFNRTQFYRLVGLPPNATPTT